jgi:hypothetical protein
MGQTEIVVRVVERKWLPQTVLVLTERAHPAADCRHMLAYGQVEALHERGVALPAARRSHLLDGLKGPAYHAIAHAHQVPPAYGLDSLGVEQLRQRPPARLGVGPFVLAA